MEFENEQEKWPDQTRHAANINVFNKKKSISAEFPPPKYMIILLERRKMRYRCDFYPSNASGNASNSLT